MRAQQTAYKPLPMLHPQFQPAQKGVSPDARKGLPGTKGHAARFPPMTTNSANDEAFLRSKGYVPNPKGRLPHMMVDGPEVIVREDDGEGGLDMIPIAEASPVNGSPALVTSGYPRYVGTVRVNSEDEHRALLEAQGGPPLPPAPAAPEKTQTLPAAQPAVAVPPPAPNREDVERGAELIVPIGVSALSKRVDTLEKNTRQILDAVNSLLEAAKPKPSPVEERDSLRREARALRLKFDGRLSTQQLRELVVAARKQPDMAP